MKKKPKIKTKEYIEKEVPLVYSGPSSGRCPTSFDAVVFQPPKPISRHNSLYLCIQINGRRKGLYLRCYTDENKVDRYRVFSLTKKTVYDKNTKWNEKIVYIRKLEGVL